MLTRDQIRAIFMGTDKICEAARKNFVSTTTVSLIRSRKLHAEKTADLTRPSETTEPA